VRFALGLMWVMLIVAETISAQSGIGYMTMNAREFMQTDVVVVGILLYALLGKLADMLARGLERWLLPWHSAFGGTPRVGAARGREAVWMQAIKRPTRLRRVKA
jgi:sulfonate transport system permease protein